MPQTLNEYREYNPRTPGRSRVAWEHDTARTWAIRECELLELLTEQQPDLAQLAAILRTLIDEGVI